jgi:hypothetical protein
MASATQARSTQQRDGTDAAGAVTMEWVDEVDIDWSAETPGVLGATYVDTVTGATWTQSGTPGTLQAEVVAGVGLVLGGTSVGAKNLYYITQCADLLPDFAPQTDIVEVVMVMTGISIPSAYSVAGSVHGDELVGHNLYKNNDGGTIRRRMVWVDGSGTIIDDVNDSATTLVTCVRRFGPGARRVRYGTSAGVVAFDSLTDHNATQTVWCAPSTTSLGNDASAVVSFPAGVWVQTNESASVSCTLERTIVRRYRGVAS